MRDGREVLGGFEGRRVEVRALNLAGWHLLSFC